MCLSYLSWYAELILVFVCLSFLAQEVDDVARVSEAVTKAVVCAIKSAQSDDNDDDWLNPTEVLITHNYIITVRNSI